MFKLIITILLTLLLSTSAYAHTNDACRAQYKVTVNYFSLFFDYVTVFAFDANEAFEKVAALRKEDPYFVVAVRLYAEDDLCLERIK